MRKRGTADNIPFEMQVEIMKWLPVKSLAVFRAVSKAWKSMIDSPLFITDHTNLRRHHRLQIRYGVVNTFCSNKIEFKYVFIKDDDTLSQHTVSNVPVSFQLFDKPKLVGTSQGLLCLSGDYRDDGCYKKTAVIWNPSLGKSIAVDVPGRPYVLGFGVRSDNFDPAIILINSVEHPIRVLVFTLSSRVWRIPRGKLPPKSIVSYDSPVGIDDQRIYWKAYEKERNLNLVATFDMVSEDFTEIQLPRSVAHRFCNDFSISKIKESHALLEYYDDDDDKPVCNVWMMVENGVFRNRSQSYSPSTHHMRLRF